MYMYICILHFIPCLKAYASQRGSYPRSINLNGFGRTKLLTFSFGFRKYSCDLSCAVYFVLVFASYQSNSGTLLYRSTLFVFDI